MNTQASTNNAGPIMTADGIPLQQSLKKSLRRSKLRASLLVLPPFLFLLFMFIFPIGDLLTRSADDNLVNDVFPLTFIEYEKWDKSATPDEAMFAALAVDLQNAEKYERGKVSTRMNYEKAGWRSLIKRTSRKVGKMEAPFKEKMIKLDKRWAEVEFWQSLGSMKDPWTFGYYLNAVDLNTMQKSTSNSKPKKSAYTTCSGYVR